MHQQHSPKPSRGREGKEGVSSEGVQRSPPASCGSQWVRGRRAHPGHPPPLGQAQRHRPHHNARRWRASSALTTRSSRCCSGTRRSSKCAIRWVARAGRWVGWPGWVCARVLMLLLHALQPPEPPPTSPFR